MEKYLHLSIEKQKEVFDLCLQDMDTAVSVIEVGDLDVFLKIGRIYADHEQGKRAAVRIIQIRMGD